MTIEELLGHYNKTGNINKDLLKPILEEQREEIITEFKQRPNRKFVLDLLNLILDLRKTEDHDLGIGDNIMLVSYMLGLHGQVEDALQIWQAKNVDFDSFNYVDIQLVVFDGVEKTLSYFKSIETEESAKAINYIINCEKSGELENLEDYFSFENLPWWV